MIEDDRIKLFTPKVVIIDDGFAPARLEKIQDQDWAALRQLEDPARWATIREAHFQSFDRVMDLKRDSVALNEAWRLYEEDPVAYGLLDPIFAPLNEGKKLELRRLQNLLEYLSTDLNVEVCKHPTIESALADIQQCKVVFLDFYLYQTSAERIIEDIAQHGDLFRAPVSGGTGGQGRIVFLISTALPPQEKVELFRKATKLKGAFFKAVSKADLTKDWIRRELAAKIARYEDLQKWVQYLDTFSKQIEEVSQELRREIEGLELHDLSILDSVRLQGDGEPLGDYLSWLFSESLAARIRQAAPLVEAGSGVEQISLVPFHGMLTPKAILFGLYSDIAFCQHSKSEEPGKIRFGDIFSSVKAGLETETVKVERAEDASAALSNPEESSRVDIEFDQDKKSAEPGAVAAKALHGGATQQMEAAKSSPELMDELILVIAPACDLQRCSAEYEVLCVRGTIEKRVADLADLLSQQAIIGKDTEVFRQLMRHVAEGRESYFKVKWSPKRITTITFAKLSDSARHRKFARLNELLAHEVKEEALHQAGRIGVPVDPSFSAALSAAIRIRKPKKPPFIKEVEESEFISGIYISANGQNPARIMLSEEFLTVIGEVIEEVGNWDVSINEKIVAALKEIQEIGGRGIHFSGKTPNQKQWDGGFKVRFVGRYRRDETIDNEIVFYPRGRLDQEKAPNNSSGKMAAAAASLASAAETVATAAETVAAAAEAIAGTEIAKKEGPEGKVDAGI